MSNAPTCEVEAQLSNFSSVSNSIRSNSNSSMVDGAVALTVDGYVETVPCGQWLSVAASRYARLGFRIGPLKGKVPLTSHGFKDFTTDPAVVAGWWRDHPQANIGACPPHGVVVLDIDPRNGGWDTWQKLNAGHVLPDTLVVSTGSHGLHYWFTLPYDSPVRGQAGDGVDIKTSTGYVVMPPSIHPDTHNHYLITQWCELAVLPEWLRASVYKPVPQIARLPRSYSKTSSVGLVRAVEQAPVGQRNNVLFWAACTALEEGVNLHAELKAAALSVGLSELEIARTLTSANTSVRGVA